MPAQKKYYCHLKTIAITIVITFICAILLGNPTPGRAQMPNLTIATTYPPAADVKISDGDIVSLTANGQITPSTEAYDKRMIGVVAKNASIVYRNSSTEIPVIRYNEALVNVTTLNGAIEKGDYITTSPIAGKGQKATKIGEYVLGIALESFTENSGNPMTIAGKQIRVGQIPVKIQISPSADISLLQVGIMGFLSQLGFSVLDLFKEPQSGTSIIRYLIAGSVAIIAIVFSFVTFGRNISQGIVAIGRNPLARVSIQTSIIINAIIIAIVSIGGIILSLAMLGF